MTRLNKGDRYIDRVIANCSDWIKKVVNPSTK